MKKIKIKLQCLLLISILIISTSCKTETANTSDKTKQTKAIKERNPLPVIDISKTYEEKEICLEDIATVKYVKLENIKDHPVHGRLNYIDNEIFIISNYRGGDLFIYNIDGTLKTRINKLGNGPNEYPELGGLTFDKKNKELFLNDIRRRQVRVFDLEGNYKRKFWTLKGKTYMKLICYKDKLIAINSTERGIETYISLSKKNGKMLADLGPKYEEKISNMISERTGKHGMIVRSFGYPQYIYSPNGLILNELSCDTIYRHLNTGKLAPLLVQTPSVKSMKTKNVLFVTGVTKDFLFMKQVLAKVKFKNINDQKSMYFENEDLVYDYNQDKTYKLKLYSKNYKQKQSYHISYSYEAGCYATLSPSHRFIEKLENGELSGSIKNIAQSLNEDDNPILSIIKFK
jgi:hypothetical protein